MSQLNNEDKKVDMKETEEEVKNKKNKKEKKAKTDKKKMKASTKIVIFLVIFAFVCVGITTALIINYKKNNVQVEEKTEEEKKKEIYEAADDGFGIKALTERYNGNDLKIETVEDGVGTRTVSSEYDRNTHKININYIKIDGLKNGEIESKINKELKDKAFSMYSSDELNNPNINFVEIDSYETANFGNVLSVQIHKWISYNSNNNQYNNDYSKEYLNFDLTTGNPIKFEEMFTNKTSLKNVLIPAINKSLRTEAMSTYEDPESYNIDFSKIDLSQIEEKSYRILDSIINDIDNTKFGFDFRFIDLKSKDYSIEIDMTTIYRNVAIYKRFLTNDSIFDGSYISEIKNAYVFSSFYVEDEKYGKDYRILEDIEDNLRVETRVYCSKEVYDEKEGKQIYDDFVEIIADQIEKLKIEAKNNPNKQILYVAEYWISGHENKILTDHGIKNLITSTSGQAKVYRMDKKYYDDTFYLKMAEQQRSMNFGGGVSSGIYFYFVEENDKNVDVEDINQEYETFDLFTNKTEDQLLGTDEITSIIEELEQRKEEAKQSDFVYVIVDESYYMSRINAIKQHYNLTEDTEILEYEARAKELVKDIQTIVEEAKAKAQAQSQEQAQAQEEQSNENTQEEATNTVDTNNTVVENNINP